MKEFFLFRGRLRRRAFWGRTISAYALAAVLYAVLSQMVIRHAATEATALLLIGLLVVLVTTIAIIQTVKRLHDVGLSGWWWWLLPLPIVGNLFGLGLPLVDGTSGPNRFGPDPKGRTAYGAPTPEALPPLPAEA